MNEPSLAPVVAAGLILFAWPMAAHAQADASPNAPIVLTNIQQIIASRPEVPAVRYEARLRAVVVHGSLSRRIYVQEGRLGLEVSLENGSGSAYQPGQLVEITGTVEPALPRPRITAATATVISKRRLAPRKGLAASSLAVGQNPFRFVSLRVMVRDIISHGAGMTLLASHDGTVFEVLINSAPYLPIPREWLDAEIEADGISIPLYSNRGQPSGFRFHLQSTNFVRVVTPGFPNQFERPLLTIADAAARPHDWKPRLKVAGTVLAHRAEGALFIQDETGVMRVELLSFLPRPSTGRHLDRELQTTLQPGERVEVIGIRHNWFSLTPTLIMAEFRRLGRAPVPPPLEVSIRDLQRGRYPGRLVSVKARLVDFRGRSSGWNIHQQSLVLQAGNEVFTARWEDEKPARWELTPNSYIQITGVNEADSSKQKDRASFQILLRSPEDVKTVPNPPFWTRPETRRVTLAAGSVGLVAAAWILLQRLHLRRLEQRVAERTTELRAEVSAREAAQKDLSIALDAEKELNQLKSSFVSMVSHEFRTPLEVILSSSNILERYFDRLPPARRATQIAAIRKNVHRMNDLIEDVLMLGRFEAGRMACKPSALDLEASCRQACADVESAADTSGRIRFTAHDLAEPAAVDETLLQHILSNLLSNALKYSPDHVPVEFTVTRRGVDAEFVIRDRGCGIPEADRARLFTAFHRGRNVGQTPGTGLGLVIVKRCVDCHGGTLSFDSVEGQGTTFTVNLPVFDGTRFFRHRGVTAAPASF